jgi:hypothetical protein
MEPLHIELDDERDEHGEHMARLREIARQRGITEEQAAMALLSDVLGAAVASPRESTTYAIPSALDISGVIADPAISPLTAEQSDLLLAGEAVNPHDDQAGYITLLK